MTADQARHSWRSLAHLPACERSTRVRVAIRRSIAATSSTEVWNNAPQSGGRTLEGRDESVYDLLAVVELGLSGKRPEVPIGRTSKTGPRTRCSPSPFHSVTASAGTNLSTPCSMAKSVFVEADGVRKSLAGIPCSAGGPGVRYVKDGLLEESLLALVTIDADDQVTSGASRSQDDGVAQGDMSFVAVEGQRDCSGSSCAS